MQAKLAEALCPSISPPSPPFRSRPKTERLGTPLELSPRSSATPITDAASIRAKEAVYTAAGRLVRFVVQNDNIPAGRLLAVLGEECLREGEQWRLLKRRIGWLIGECVLPPPPPDPLSCPQISTLLLLTLSLRLVEADDELAGSDAPWQPLLYLVTDRSTSSDAGVRLTAAGALKSAMDLWELDPAVFAPYVRTFPLSQASVRCCRDDEALICPRPSPSLGTSSCRSLG